MYIRWFISSKVIETCNRDNRWCIEGWYCSNKPQTWWKAMRKQCLSSYVVSYILRPYYEHEIVIEKSSCFPWYIFEYKTAKKPCFMQFRTSGRLSLRTSGVLYSDVRKTKQRRKGIVPIHKPVSYGTISVLSMLFSNR